MVHFVQFQKRRLPHAHIIVILKGEYKPSPDDDDLYVFAYQLPDPDLQPRLLHRVVFGMIPGPRGDSTCIKDGKCSKGCLCDFSNETVSYLVYLACASPTKPTCTRVALSSTLGEGRPESTRLGRGVFTSGGDEWATGRWCPNLPHQVASMRSDHCRHLLLGSRR